jgi:hypothetical protein
MFSCDDWSRDDVAGIPFADAVPQKRRAKPPGSDRRCREGDVRLSGPLHCSRFITRSHHLCRRQAALHGASGAPRSSMECSQRHCAIHHRLITWRVTELYGVQRRRRRRRCTEECVCWADREEVQRRRMRRHHLVGARRLCTALLGHRVRKWNARDIITQPITA